MTINWKLYAGGAVQFVDERITTPVAFAHVTDLHLPGIPTDAWPAQYRHGIEWWNVDMGYPDRIVGDLLDRVGQAEVDFVFFGGDVIDYYDAGAAEHLVEACRRRGLRPYFQIGNHDAENHYLRFISHEFDAGVFAANGRKLCAHWDMPDLDYAFEVGGVRFIALTLEYKRGSGGLGGVVKNGQAEWFIEQADFDGPVVVFEHIPFGLPTVADRLRRFWSGSLACVVADGNGRRLSEAIEGSANILGMFTGHAHMRSEDPFGRTWQFMTGPAHLGEWRYVKIHDTPPPKSLGIAGEPTVP